MLFLAEVSTLTYLIKSLFYDELALASRTASLT
jgi:hypothetical protein